MRFVHDSRGIKPTGGYEPAPKGRYLLRIEQVESGVTRNGDRMAIVHFEIDNPPTMDGVSTLGLKIKYHNVVFKRKGEKGAGIALHFLKCIGEPHEESEGLDVDTTRWINKRLYADVDIQPYTTKQGQQKKKNVVVNVYAGPNADPVNQTLATSSSDEEIPF